LSKPDDSVVSIGQAATRATMLIGALVAAAWLT
jgi:hypothetical protein